MPPLPFLNGSIQLIQAQKKGFRIKPGRGSDSLRSPGTNTQTRCLLPCQAAPKGSSPAFIFLFSSLRPKEKKKNKKKNSIELCSHLPPPEHRAAAERGVNGRGGKKQSTAPSSRHQAAAVRGSGLLSPSRRAALVGRRFCGVLSTTILISLLNTSRAETFHTHRGRGTG